MCAHAHVHAHAPCTHPVTPCLTLYTQPHPASLWQVGEFFESVGIDAVLLVQHAGLNPMGAGNPPRAGCPRVNLRRTVADLVHAGLSVVRAVCDVRAAAELGVGRQEKSIGIC